MPVLARFCGIVIRMLTDRTFGIHFHAFYRGTEMVVGLRPLRVIQSEAPAWVEACVLEWVHWHEQDFVPGWNWNWVAGPARCSPSLRR